MRACFPHLTEENLDGALADAGGKATATNIELRCRAHNAYEAEQYFGAEVVAAARDRAASVPSPGATASRSPDSSRDEAVPLATARCPTTPPVRD